MPVNSVTKDPDALTLTVLADFPVPRQRLWDAYADPRQLERFWGPPTYPAVFTRHDMFPGGLSLYAMTGPEGDVSRGYWEFLHVVPGESFEVLDGFANPDGAPNQQMPSMRMVYTFASTTTGSQLTTVTRFNSLDEFEKLIEMGMLEGMHAAMGQMDEVLADLTTFATDSAVILQVLSDTVVRTSRVIRGTVEQVWHAHHDPHLLRQWLLGPDGWTMPICDVANAVGDTFHYEWAEVDGTGSFGFTGEVLASSPPHREVTTEVLIGMEGSGAINDMTLTAVEGGTLLTILITYPSIEVRDTVLGTGMTDGMEASYTRLERVLGAAN